MYYFIFLKALCRAGSRMSSFARSAFGGTSSHDGSSNAGGAAFGANGRLALFRRMSSVGSSGVGSTSNTPLASPLLNNSHSGSTSGAAGKANRNGLSNAGTSTLLLVNGNE